MSDVCDHVCVHDLIIEFCVLMRGHAGDCKTAEAVAAITNDDVAAAMLDDAPNEYGDEYGFSAARIFFGGVMKRTVS